jgi:diadenosine tetraphosphatase ApaH/serine/threonine PP2A family protein phosphatase
MIDRVTEIPDKGDLCELLWNDPDEETPKFKESPRGIGKLFGQEPNREFLLVNGL